MRNPKARKSTTRMTIVRRMVTTRKTTRERIACRGTIHNRPIMTSARKITYLQIMKSYKNNHERTVKDQQDDEHAKKLVVQKQKL